MICDKDSNNHSNIDTLDGGSLDTNKMYVDNSEYQYLKSFYEESLEGNFKACNFLENFKPKPKSYSDKYSYKNFHFTILQTTLVT